MGGIITGVLLHQIHVYFLEPYIRKGRWTSELFYLVVGLHAKCAKADGAVSPAEIKAFREAVRVPLKYWHQAGAVFDSARKSTKGYEAFAQRLNEHLGELSDDKRVILHGLYYTAASNGVIAENQLAFLKVCGNLLHIGADEQRYLRHAWGVSETGELLHGFGGAGEGLGGNSSDASGRINSGLKIAGQSVYKILGVKEGVSSEALRTAYKKNVKKYHPDKLRGEGASDLEIKRAEKKLLEITEAYEMLKIALK